MNQLGAVSPQTIFWLTVGAVCGGAAGFMISEVVIDRLMYDHLEDEDKNGVFKDGDGPDPVGFEMPEESIKKVNYGDSDKKALSELVREYESDAEEAIRIIDKSRIYDPIEIIQYYPDDNTYCYEGGDLIDDPNGQFIPNAHLHFGEGCPDPFIVYVQNDDVGVCYEILKVGGSYKETILGEVSEEEKPKKKASVKRSRRAATQPKKGPVEELTDDPHETDGK